MVEDKRLEECGVLVYSDFGELYDAGTVLRIEYNLEKFDPRLVEAFREFRLRAMSVVVDDPFRYWSGLRDNNPVLYDEVRVGTYLLKMCAFKEPYIQVELYDTSNCVDAN